MERNYQTFRGLLRDAICTRTQAQFANESGISAEHLSRMLNTDVIHRPTRTTLQKIAKAAKNGVTFQNLMDALDADDGTVGHPSPLRELQAKLDFAPDFRTIAANTMSALCDVVERQTYPVIVTSVADHVTNLVDGIKNEPGEHLPVAYEVGVGRPNFGTRHKYASHYATVYLSMANAAETASSEMMVYYTVIPCDGGEKRYVVQTVTCAVEAISDQHGTSKAMLDFTTNYFRPNAKGVDALEASFDSPYYLDFAPVERFREEYRPEGETVEERFMDRVFGQEFRWSETVDGVGFWIPDVPTGLARFLAQHAKPVLDNYEDETEPESYERLERAIREWGTLEDDAGVARTLDEMKYQDAEMRGDAGWPAAVAEVMRAETGFPFYYHAPAKDPTEFPDLSERGCVMIRVEDQESDDIQREAVLFALSRYARALGIKKFGDLLFTGVREVLRKPRTYVVKENAPDGEDEVVLDEDDVFVEFRGIVEGPWPAEDGLYTVELKDGRRMNIVYLKKPGRGVWIRRHKEWSHMIARYRPDKLPTGNVPPDATPVENEDQNQD